MPASAYAWFFRRQASAIREQDRLDREKARLTREVLEREAVENEVCYQAWGQGIPDFSTRKYPLMVLPHNGRSLRPLPRSRKRAFRDGLAPKIASALALIRENQDVPHNSAASGAASVWVREACTLCAGACCLAGANHAFLSESTLARVMRQQASLQADQILDLYVSRLGGKTYVGACVYQGEKGCLLPAELRSDTCHNYYCSPVEEFAKPQDGCGKPEGVFVMLRAREHWPFPFGLDQGILGTFLITESKTQPLASGTPSATG